MLIFICINMYGVQRKWKVILNEGLVWEDVGQEVRNQFILEKNKVGRKWKSFRIVEMERR